ncbi:Protein CBG24683 [Caenorhabditis briggsae]|uniref:Uncharacterized protein n=3 Tax=Caenorhabditis briggsae TaxID=6238 RepID=A0AAE9DAG8_CAEBR|nr:Protein CBG24683 [Caenorhabditis briggsae]ULT99785.1 hypothetical protein L3Y34_000814 [Caenorhabditis briggsae]CAP21234.1 Protein CBG24683 [Caenorhabditis briggsae]
MEQQQMTLLSIETVLKFTPIEKLWQMRIENPVLKEISDKVPYDEMRKWIIDAIIITDDRIASRRAEDFFAELKFIQIKGSRQTRWLSPKFLQLATSSEILKDSVLPVAKTFCKEILSIDISEMNEEFLKSVFQLFPFCLELGAVSMHIKNLKENSLLECVKWLKKIDIKSGICMSLSSSAEITPRFIEDFFTIASQDKTAIMFRQLDDSETSTNKRAAILRFFSLPDWTVPARYLTIEQMDKETTELIFGELEHLYPNGGVFYENGAKAFHISGPTPTSIAQLEIRKMV